MDAEEDVGVDEETRLLEEEVERMRERLRSRRELGLGPGIVRSRETDLPGSGGQMVAQRGEWCWRGQDLLL